MHFGDRLASYLPENIVAGLQSRVGAEEVVTLDSSIKIGQAVEIIEGPFRERFGPSNCYYVIYSP